MFYRATPEAVSDFCAYVFVGGGRGVMLNNAHTEDEFF